MRLKNSLLLLLTATIWGVAFVAQSAGMDYVGPFTFNCARCLIGALVLVPLIFFMDRGKKRQREIPVENKKVLILGGVCCGLALFLASNFQQFGIQYTTVGKAGFITACYIVIVPLLGLFFGKKCSPLIWGAVVMAVVGLYMLCMTGGSGGINRGDLLMLVCAVLFSVHILVIDYFSPKADGVVISCVQFFTAGVLACVLMLLFEHPSMSAVIAAAAPILYAGVMSCGVGYTLQVVAQNGVDPTIASLLLSLESVFSVLAGWVILGQKLSGRELFGCALVFAAVLLVQIPTEKLFPCRK